MEILIKDGGMKILKADAKDMIYWGKMLMIAAELRMTQELKENLVIEDKEANAK